MNKYHAFIVLLFLFLGSFFHRSMAMKWKKESLFSIGLFSRKSSDSGDSSGIWSRKSDKSIDLESMLRMSDEDSSSSSQLDEYDECIDRPMFLCDRDSLASVEKVIQYYGVNAPNERGETYLHYAAKNQITADTLIYLLSYRKVNVRKIDNEKCSVLDHFIISLDDRNLQNDKVKKVSRCMLKELLCALSSAKMVRTSFKKASKQQKKKLLILFDGIRSPMKKRKEIAQARSILVSLHKEK